MTQLFSEHRRRFARSSADVTSDTALKALPPAELDVDITPVTPMEDQDLTPVTPIEPVHAITEETTVPVEAIAEALPPAPLVRFLRPPTITAEVPRLAHASPYSGTALVRRQAPKRFEAWWIAVGVFVLAVIVAILR
jgi:hypothetical protein